MKVKFIITGLVLGLWLSAGIVQSQESRATITGIVTDPQGKTVPGATIQAKNLATNVVTSVATSDGGLYTIPPVNPGNYSVTVSAPGFKAMLQSNVELRVGDRKQVNFSLELGTPTEIVTVTADATLLETASASVGTTIGREAISNLPMMGRNPLMLAQYTAGVQYSGRASSAQRPFDNGGMEGFNIDGGGSGRNEFLLDGVPNTNNQDTGTGTYITFAPPPDAVSEFKVSTNLYDSEYGRTGGGVISLNLKSGTNAYHGAAYWYQRRNGWNANDTTANKAGQALAKFRWNQPGAQIEGPVWIPGVYNGADKTFFMYSWEAIRSSIPRVSSFVMPTDLQRKGDFSQTYVSGTSGATVALYDPLTTVQTSPGKYARTAFNGSVIPTSRINPIATKILTYFPKPAITDVARGVTNLVVSPNATTDAYDVHTIRIDQVLNDKNKFFASFMRSNRHEDGGLGGGKDIFKAMGILEAAPSYKHWRTNHGTNLNLTTTISPTFINTAKVAWNLHELAIVTYAMDFDPANLGFSFTPQNKTFPQISIGGFTSIGNSRDSQDNFSHTWSFGDSMNKVMSNHSLKWGGEFRLMLNNLGPARASAYISSSVNFTRADPLVTSAASGDGLASFLLGYPSSVSSPVVNQPARAQRYYSLFVQDDWHFTRKMTLNLGLRWDYESPMTDRFDRQIIGFDPTSTATIGTTTVTGGVIFADSKHRFAYKRDLNNWQPRVGIAYQVKSKLVLRGGWGISYVSGSGDAPPTDGFTMTTSPSTSEGNAGIIPLLYNGLGMLSNPFPTGITQPYGSKLGILTNAGSGISYYWPDRSIPYVHSFSAGFQYELPFRTVVDLSYVASRSRQLSTSRSMNSVTYAQYMANGSKLTTTVPNPFAGLLPGTSLDGTTRTLQQSLLPYPQFTGITENGRTIGTSRYDSLQARIEKRFSAGFTFLFTGTWAKGSTYNSYLNGGMDDIGQFITRIDGTPPYTFNWSGTYALPFFANAAPALRMVLGGWMLAGTANYTRGGMIGVGGANPTGIDPRIPNPTEAHMFNTCTYNDNTGLRQNCQSTTEPIAWIITKPYTLLTYPSPQFTYWRQPNPPQINMSLFKSVKFKERAKLEFRAEAFNLTNSPVNNYANTTATASTFGARTTISQGNDPRQVQMGLRLSF
jgi:hypothetical protein